MPFEFLQRHIAGDWGEDLCERTAKPTTKRLVDGSRLLSAYRLKDGTKIWVITEAANDKGSREATTFLLPEEY